MPSVDEESQRRETYGNAPGWSANQLGEGAVGSPAPQPDAAPADSSPAQDAPADSSPAPEAAPSESQPEPQAEPQKVWHQPPQERWDEIRAQAKAEKDRADRAEQLAQLALQKLQAPQAPPAVPGPDVWAGKVDHPDPATAQFWQQQRDAMRLEAKRVAEEQLAGVMDVINVGRQKIAQFEAREFRRENPEVKPGSQEEAMVVAYMNQGHDIVNAKKLALFDKLEAENRALKSKQALTPQKRQAAQTESSAGIPSTAGLPQRPGSWQDKANEVLDKGGDIQDVLKTVFGKRRR